MGRQLLHITRPNIRGLDVGWVAQKRDLGLYRARFPTALAAAEWLAKRMRVSIDQLKRPSSKSVRHQVVEARRPSFTLPVSRYHGVIADRGYFIARHGGRNLARFTSQSAAARCVAGARRTTVKKLLKKVKLSGALARRLFKAALTAFGKYIPGDVKSLRAHEHDSKSMFTKDPSGWQCWSGFCAAGVYAVVGLVSVRGLVACGPSLILIALPSWTHRLTRQLPSPRPLPSCFRDSLAFVCSLSPCKCSRLSLQEPTMRIISLLLKYGYWRDALRNAFYAVLEQWPGHRGVVSLRARAEFCLEVLRKLCVTMSGVVSKPWIDNVGYNIGFCSGPVPFLTKTVAVIKSTTQANTLRFGLGYDWKELRTSAADTEKSLKKIERLVTIGDVVAKQPAPRTCQEWIDGFHVVLNVVEGSRFARPKLSL